MTAKLIAEEGSLEGLVLSFDEGDEWVIGRDPDTCQLLVKDPDISKEQLLAKRAGATVSLENLSASRPVLVNDAPLKKSQALRHGDSVRLGGNLFRFYTDIGGHAMDKADKTNPKPAKGDAARDTLFDHENQPAERLLADIDFNIHETGRWMLKVIAGPNNGAEFAMEPGRTYILGTAPDSCDIVFHDGTVSRQHAKLSISSDNKITIQDLKSRNGVMVNEKAIKGKGDVPSNSVVSLGTTRFLVFDREADRHTIITPLLPALVKTLKAEEEKRPLKGKTKADSSAQSAVDIPKKPGFFRKLVMIVFIAGFIGIVIMGTSSLFRTQEIVASKVDIRAELAKAMAAYPNINYNYDENSGTLLLIGHVTKAVDRDQLLFTLKAELPFVRDINYKSLIIDEGVLQNYNQILGRNPQWAGINLTSPAPGRFVLNGYLEKREQADKLADYMAQNFPYIDLLERRVFVVEDELNAIRSKLQEAGLKEVTVQMTGSELTLGGTMYAGRGPKLEALIAQFKKNPAIRVVRNFVVELATETTIVDLSTAYKVTGSSNRGSKVLNVVINGKILMPGDILDGMTVTELKRDTVMLERDGIKYKIEYNK